MKLFERWLLEVIYDKTPRIPIKNGYDQGQKHVFKVTLQLYIQLILLPVQDAIPFTIKDTILLPL